MNESAQQAAEVPVPTDGQVLARAVPAAAVLKIGITASSGRLPEDPHNRVAAGVLACTQLESTAMIVAGVASVVAIWILRTETWWAVTAVLMMLIAVVPVVRVRRGWAHLDALHSAERTG
jgi:ABC-type siderophore export system fused ATPase/permease subunit